MEPPSHLTKPRYGAHAASRSFARVRTASVASYRLLIRQIC